MKKYIYTFWILPIVFVSCVQQPYNRIHDMPLDVNKLESLGNSDSLMKALKDIAQKSHDCGVKEVPKFRRYFLKNKTVTCNDGSPAGYVQYFFICTFIDVRSIISDLCFH